MVMHTLGLAFAALLAAADSVPPVRTMYNDALAREQTVRTALSAESATDAVLTDVRRVIAQYELLVKTYPASGYSDNALWQAGQLAADAFLKFNQAQDKDVAVRLLRRLAHGYPSSKLVPDIPAQLARLGTELPAPKPGADAPSAKSDSTLATIKSIKRSVLADTVRVVIELDSEVSFHDERITDPMRVFLDLPATRAASSLVDKTIRFESDADVVRQVRLGRHPNNVTRVVLDADGVSSYSVYPLYQPFRLVIDCVRPTTAHTRREASPPAPEPPAAAPLVTPLLAVTPPVTRAEIAKAEPVKTDAAKTDESLNAPATRNSTGKFSIARQLGLGVSRIVIDAGHGGHDPGAKGRGVVEAELVLDVALRLEKLLQKTPGVDVILTRRTDDFIALEERTALANREGADLFLSIHANASPSAQAHGVETYFLNFATNLSAAAVAARENAASGQAMSALPDIVKSIALNNKLDESRDLAGTVQNAMLERLKPANKTIRDLGVKQAPFVVLIGAAMPSVLAEISFVTNPQEARLLKSNPYRQRIAEALYNAIRKYQSSLKTGTSVAPQ